MIYKYVNNGSLLIKIVITFRLSTSHFIDEILNKIYENWHQ